MKRLLLIPILILAVACGSQSAGSAQTNSVPGHGAIAFTIVPNPIVATSAGGDTYDFPFEVVIRETGGVPVNITRVSADVLALGQIRVASESYDADRIRSLGFATSIPANGELRYQFRPRKEVADDRLFGGVTAEVRVEAMDASGTPTSATTSVSVTR